MSKNLTEVLNNIRYEYDVAYEYYYDQALARAIKIINEHGIDEEWTDEEAEKQFKIMQEKLDKEDEAS